VVSATGQAIYANPNPRVFPPHDTFDGTWAVGITLSYSPNDLANGSASARGLDARAASIDAQAASLRDALRADLSAAAGALRENVVAMETTARALESAEEAYRVRRELFRAGRATTAEITDAETDLLRARIESANAVVDRRVARARIEYLLGRADAALSGAR
jgi:outer membrane protein